MTRKKTSRKDPEEPAVPLLSFFTGGGFLDMGFEQAGFTVVWTNEFDPVVAEMYGFGMSRWREATSKNAVPAEISNRKDIQKLFAPEILAQAFPKRKPSSYGVIGGPPCRDFSQGGKHRGVKGANGKLTRTFFNRVCSLMPRFFVFENVAGLYRIRLHREFLKKLEKRLESRGYCLDFRILNALEMGVPQDRERLILIGIESSFARKCAGRKIGSSERDWFPWPEIPIYKGAKTAHKWPQSGKFRGSPKLRKGIPYELTVDSVLNSASLPEDIANGKDVFAAYSDRFSIIKEGDTKRRSFKRLHRYRFSPTACYGHNEVHLHPWKKRRLSVREAMRIQGIPDEYHLPPHMTLSGKFAVVSNGVPVPLAHQVALCLKAFIRNEWVP